MWSELYLGVTHRGQPGDMRWATVVTWDNGTADLDRNLRGTLQCACPTESFESVDAAKAAGDLWVDRGVLA